MSSISVNLDMKNNIRCGSKRCYVDGAAALLTSRENYSVHGGLHFESSLQLLITSVLRQEGMEV